MYKWLLVVSMPVVAIACSFDNTGVLHSTDGMDGGSPDAGMTNGNDTGMPGGDACMPGCVGDELFTCAPVLTSEICPLGCDPQQPACLELSPSNGAALSFLDGTMEALDIPDSVMASINSDTGEIRIAGVERRPPGGGVLNGLRFNAIDASVNVLTVTSMSVGSVAYLQIVGTKPLIILSDGAVVIEGMIDISGGCTSNANHCGGPGGGSGSTAGEDQGGELMENFASGCAPGQNGTGDEGSVSETGGGGGSLGTVGGNGGSGGGESGGLGGVLPGQCPVENLIPLTGGSGGGAGGEGTDGGTGGGGGGALQISSRTSIRLTGQFVDQPVGIRASGAGGMGGEVSDGGGGGGSGGGILLEAPRIQMQYAILAANGGGGGGGGGDRQDNRGQDGPFGAEQAQGGTGTHAGGDGASFMGGATNGAGGDDDTGGGGGGAGIIRLNVPATALDIAEGVIISPTHVRADIVTE